VLPPPTEGGVYFLAVMTGQGHPVYGLVHGLADRHPDLTLEFSRYIHLGPGRTLSREIVQVPAKCVDVGWVEDQTLRLSDRQELALHSRALRGDMAFHIPMVDFAHVDSIPTLLSRMQPVRRQLPVDITLYNSGRSLHGYHFCLISEGEWYRYLGSLLLCNNPGAELVDSRWVGHSLEHGFSALRWSCNSEVYESLPEMVDLEPYLSARTWQ